MEFDDEEEVVGFSVVRSFMVTGGRTEAAPVEVDIQFETMVEVDAAGASAASLQFERLDIVRYVESVERTSVAEISAFLKLPLLSTHVLVTDLVGASALRAHETMDLDVDLDIDMLSSIRSAILSL